MRLLAIDTSSDACSVALRIDGRDIERHTVQPREHTNLLMPMIRDVLAEGDASLGDLDAIVLGNGPGSFIGMRIAASVAQGLCFGAGLLLLPVSSLSAVAAEVFVIDSAAAVAVAQDARMQQVYLGLFEAGERGLPEAVRGESLQPAGAIDSLGDEPRWVAAGGGWRRHPGMLQANRPALSAVSDVRYPRATYLLGSGERAWDEGLAIPPERLQPAYIRVRVAEPPAGPET